MPETNRALHPIRTVARRTGLEPHVIRAWERRYGAVSPRRTAGGQRAYSEAEIERLALLRRVTRTGRPIGRVAALDEAELERLLPAAGAAEGGAPSAAPPAGGSPGRSEEPLDAAAVSRPGIEACLAAARTLDGRTLSTLLERDLVELGPRRVLSQLVEPLAIRLENLRQQGLLRAMHVEMASANLRSFVDSLIRRQRPPEGAPVLVVATLVGRRHEVGAYLLAAGAAFEGWRVVYLGVELASEEIVAAALETSAAAVGLSLGPQALDPLLCDELLQVRRHLPPAVPVVAGTAAGDEVLRAAEAIVVADFEHLTSVLAELRQGRWPLPQGAAGSSAPATAATRAVAARPPVLSAFGGPRTATPPERSPIRREIPLSRRVRERSSFDHRLISDNGGLLLENLQRVRVQVMRLNARREQPLKVGRLHALALSVELARHLIEGADEGGALLTGALAWLQERFGTPAVDLALRSCRELFPAAAFTGVTAAAAARAGAQQPEALLEKLLLLWLLNANPAAGPARDLFDDTELESASGYRAMIAGLESFLRRLPGPGGANLFEVLRRPVLQGRSSLARQLEVLRDVQQGIDPRWVDPVLVGLDLLHEEEGDVQAPAASPAPPVVALDFANLEPGDVAFRREPPWMRRLVVMARHVHVWLSQLSESLGQRIERLDQVPDEELAKFADWGFTGLWLIGLWKRSAASQRIKQLAGDPQALASAYAVAEYRVAGDLGGEPAFQDLKRRAEAHGLRLVCDLVPNHMGLDSPWVLEHPERFISLDHSPFPDYAFTGPDLAPDHPRVALHLEDGYADQSRAAVVFRRTDRSTGEARYVYHGNDGTGLPWNDTAQLDVLKPEVRERLVRLVVELAGRCPVIRIDAAMALLKRHVQRLWYPPPGQGGAIPSRAEHALSQEELDRLMPEELWRQVIDALAEEAPDTLLLAEGFWLTEKYFLTTLGMHRVYHSAFMHMLRDEENARFRRSLAEMLAFEPRLLERFVNFLSNPDEPSAAEQLGKGDKYFGLCVLLATLPGLPLFAHGQVEGLLERYGMDYRHPHFLEAPEPAFVERHEREIVPLLRQRRRFADAQGFRLYDFVTGDAGDGQVDDDVFALSSGEGMETVLVVVHNRRSVTRGRLRCAVPRRALDTGEIVYEELVDVLAAGSVPTPPTFTLHNAIKGARLEVDAGELKQRGLPLELGPYEYRVFQGIDPDSDKAPWASQTPGQQI